MDLEHWCQPGEHQTAFQPGTDLVTSYNYVAHEMFTLKQVVCPLFGIKYIPMLLHQT